jgi:hypothetical protein
MKVLYVLGSARSGSTILANVLESLPGVFSAGELRFLWERVEDGRHCGCGEPVDGCPVWAKVLDRVAGLELLPPSALASWERREFRLPRTPALLARGPVSSSDPGGPLERYLRITESVFAALEDVTRARVVVDSSKRPSNGAAMRLLPDLDVYFVHIVRDPRAVAYSRLRPKPNPDRPEGDHTMPLSSVPNSALHWVGTNVAADAVRFRHGRGRSLLVRYEDFVLRPAHWVQRIAQMIGEPFDPETIGPDGSVRLERNHTVAGNPARFDRGTVALRPDIRWRREMSPRALRMTTGLTFPFLLRYGYRLGPSRDPRAN